MEVNMKTLIYTAIFAMTFSVSVLAQANDSTKVRKQKKETVKTEVQQKVQQQETVTSRRRNKDVFIDKDGDGICDQRVKGLLFEKLRKRHRAGQNGGGHNGGGGRQ
jgi:hypothetical protein